MPSRCAARAGKGSHQELREKRSARRCVRGQAASPWVPTPFAKNRPISRCTQNHPASRHLLLLQTGYACVPCDNGRWPYVLEFQSAMFFQRTARGSWIALEGRQEMFLEQGLRRFVYLERKTARSATGSHHTHRPNRPDHTSFLFLLKKRRLKYRKMQLLRK